MRENALLVTSCRLSSQRSCTHALSLPCWRATCSANWASYRGEPRVPRAVRRYRNNLCSSASWLYKLTCTQQRCLRPSTHINGWAMRQPGLSLGDHTVHREHGQFTFTIHYVADSCCAPPGYGAWYQWIAAVRCSAPQSAGHSPAAGCPGTLRRRSSRPAAGGEHPGEACRPSRLLWCLQERPQAEPAVTLPFREMILTWLLLHSNPDHRHVWLYLSAQRSFMRLCIASNTELCSCAASAPAQTCRQARGRC